MTLLSKTLTWYSLKLETYPIATKAISSGIVAASGDAFCQYLEGNDEFDAARTSRFGFLGFGLIGIPLHFWYGALSTRIPGSTVAAACKRTLVDQTVASPLIVVTFMSSLMMLEGKGSEEIKPKLEKDLVDTLVVNWGMWIPAQFINFLYVPVNYRVLFSNFIGFLWNTYFSYKSSGKRAVQSLPESDTESRR